MAENLKLNYEILQLCSNLKAHQDAWPYYSALESERSLERILITVNTKDIPLGKKISKAHLKLNLTAPFKGNPADLLKYDAVRGSMDDEKSFIHRFSKTKDCLSRQQARTYPVTLDITDMMRLWAERPKKNKGLLLRSALKDRPCGICGDCECSVTLEESEAKDESSHPHPYRERAEPCSCDVECYPRSVFKMKTFFIDSERRYVYSHSIDTSDVKDVTFFVKNLGCSDIQVSLQISPDKYDFCDDPETVAISSGDIRQITPCVPSNFVRIKIRNPEGPYIHAKIWYEHRLG